MASTGLAAPVVGPGINNAPDQTGDKDPVILKMRATLKMSKRGVEKLRPRWPGGVIKSQMLYLFRMKLH